MEEVERGTKQVLRRGTEQATQAFSPDAQPERAVVIDPEKSTGFYCHNLPADAFIGLHENFDLTRFHFGSLVRGNSVP